MGSLSFSLSNAALLLPFASLRLLDDGSMLDMTIGRKEVSAQTHFRIRTIRDVFLTIFLPLPDIQHKITHQAGVSYAVHCRVFKLTNP